MPKRGEFLPWRIVFRYPNGVKGTEVLRSVDDVMREGAALLHRGADIDIAQVDPVSRKATVLRTITADEVDFGTELGAGGHRDVLRAWMTAHPVRSS
jgi:hypothetical protein